MIIARNMLSALVLAALLGAVAPASARAGDVPAAPSPTAAAAADPAEVARLVALLGSDSWEEREQATRRLSEIGRPAREALAAALESADAEVRFRARLVLRAPLRTVRRLLEQTAAQGDALEGDAFRAIVDMGEDAIDPLTQVIGAELSSEDWRNDASVRCAFVALQRIASPKAVAPLLALIDGRLERFGPLYAQALEASGADEARRGLAARLDDKDPTIRRVAVEMLCALERPHPDVVAALERALLDPELSVRVAALPGIERLAALGRGPRLGSGDGVGELHVRLAGGRRVVVVNLGGRPVRIIDAPELPERPAAPADPSESAEAKAARAALEKEIAARAVQALLRALDDEHEQVQLPAVRALAGLDVRAALPRLRAILAEGTPDARLTAVIATLAAMDDRESIPRMMALLAHNRGDIVAAAGLALARLRVTDAVPALVQKLLPTSDDPGEAPEDSVREQAAVSQEALLRALGDLADPRALEPLAARYATADHLRPLVGDAIGRLPGPGARAWLRERALAVLDLPVSAAALERLDARGDEGALSDDEAAEEAALAFLRTPGAPKDEALRILSRRGFRPAYDAVLPLAGEINGPFRADAIRALGEIGDKRAIPVLRRYLVEAGDASRMREVVMLALARLGDVESLAKAIEEGKKQVESEGETESPLTGLGILHLYRRDYEAALACFTKIIEMSPDSNIASYNIACTHALAGRVDEALRWLERSVESGFDDPRHMDADDDLDAIRDTERYRALRKKMLEAVPPEAPRAVGGFLRLGGQPGGGAIIEVGDEPQIFFPGAAPAEPVPKEGGE